jgi:hypothetical protein
LIRSSGLSAAENALWPIVYRWHYRRDTLAEVEPPHATTLREREDPEFVAMLSAANRSSGVWDPGWNIREAKANEFVCERNGLVLRVPASCVRGSQTVDVLFPPNAVTGCAAITAPGAAAQPSRIFASISQ